MQQCDFCKKYVKYGEQNFLLLSIDSDYSYQETVMLCQRCYQEELQLRKELADGGIK